MPGLSSIALTLCHSFCIERHIKGVSLYLASHAPLNSRVLIHCWFNTNRLTTFCDCSIKIMKWKTVSDQLQQPTVQRWGKARKKIQP